MNFHMYTIAKLCPIYPWQSVWINDLVFIVYAPRSQVQPPGFNNRIGVDKFTVKSKTMKVIQCDHVWKRDKEIRWTLFKFIFGVL